MCVIGIGTFTLMDAGLTSVLTHNLSPVITEHFEMIVNSSTALLSLPASQLVKWMYNALESTEEFVTPFALHATFTIGLIAIVLFQYE